MSIADWDEATLERFVQDRVFGDPRLAGLLAREGLFPRCTTAELPANPTRGTVRHLTDGGAGAEFQAWNGSAWVNLG